MTRRCDPCDHNWPVDGEYMICPDCNATTDLDYMKKPMSFKEAQALYNEIKIRDAARRESDEKHEEFNQKYAEREVTAFREELDAWLSLEVQ